MGSASKKSPAEQRPDSQSPKLKLKTPPKRPFLREFYPDFTYFLQRKDGK